MLRQRSGRTRMRRIFGLWLLVWAAAAHGGEPAPTFTLPALDGGAPIALESFRGKIVLLDFWASWCGPCRAAMPAYQVLHERYAARGFSVLAVNLDEAPADGRAFLARVAVNYPIASDPQGSSAEQYRLTGMPTALLIDRRGEVRRRWVGFKDEELPALRRDIEALLAEAP